MAEPCARRNPLLRSGLTQDGRRRIELGAGHFLPDERDLADLILFGQRFAKHIQYYDASNAKAGNWSAFFESDVAASLAALAKLPVDAFRSFQVDLERWLRADPARDPAQLSAHAKLVFHLPVVLLELAGAQHARLPADHPLVSALTTLAERDLAAPLTDLISWYKGATTVAGAGNALFDDTALAMADYNVAGAPGDHRVRLSSTIAAAIASRPRLSRAPVPNLIMSAIAPGTWNGLFAGTAADTSPYLDAVGAQHQRYEQIFDALTYNLLSTAVQRIYQGLERVQRDVSVHLKASLESFAGHTPHYGLWLAFLQLFEHARKELNAFTGRHLDFYFRDVLRLGNRAAVPDKVHVLFELGRGHEAQLLEAGSLFRAEKDKLGKAIFYALDNDIVINRASVAELRGLQIEALGSSSPLEQVPLAAPVVRSRDGLGEVDLAKDDPSWPPFGPLDSPPARVGFAIADRKLFLREGLRTIVIRAELAEAVASTSIAPPWVVRLTGDKGWFELSGRSQIRTVVDNSFTEPQDEPEEPQEEPPDRRAPPRGRGGGRAAGRGTAKRRAAGAAEARRRARVEEEEAKEFRGSRRDRGRRQAPTPASRILEITVTLDADDPPVVPLDAKLHGTEHRAGLPVIEVAFDFADDDAARAFAVLRNVRAERVALSTKASGLKNLMVIAGSGTADPAKPFAPFGNQPRAGAFFTIGSSEIFSKSIADWSLEVDWQTPYTNYGFFRNLTADSYDATEAVLSEGRWVPVAGSTRRPRGGARRHDRRRPGVDADLHLGEGNGKIDLNSGSLIDGRTEQTLENRPLDTKAVNGFMRMRLPVDFGHADFVGENTRALIALATKVTYTPSSGVNAPSGTPREPYEAVITRLEASYETPRQAVESFSLLHPFGASDGRANGRLFPDFAFEGALLVGVKDFDPPARLTLLVQVTDGSGDPLKQAPALQFSFLNGDDWTAFEPQDVDDKTRNLTGSGVLGLNVPEEADTSHRLLPAGLHWFRIAALRDADALNRLLSVDAQAARASFADAGNDPARLETPLAAGTISKLVAPEPAIKKIVQPYNSFDGRPVETAPAFATRVSERLRHKDRAIAMFDYESLVLEAFPRLYRVKCLNTTELARNADNRIVADDELMPGAVTVVTVPWTHGQNTRNPLRPYTDQSTLAAVEEFLRRRISPFVRLEVQNPKFEEVQVDFQVKFKPEIGDIAFYIDELNKAVISFLTPWSQPGGGEITFGGKLWKSTIIDFVEEQPQVDFVTTFRLFHKVDVDAPDGSWNPVDVEVIEATTARSILLSAARHIISEVNNA